MKANRLAGHTIADEGRVRSGATQVRRAAIACSCGEESPPLGSDRARRAWHRAHKDAARARLLATPPPDVVIPQGLAGCVVDHCGKALVARGRCSSHYEIWRKATPRSDRSVPSRLRVKTPEQRFRERVSMGDVSECWPWHAPVDRNGYGTFFVSTVRGKVPAAAFAVELATGEICPPGKEACHRCDNPPCCNPAHIYYGTRKENVADAWAHGRGPIGALKKSVLTAEQVIAVRVQYADGATRRQLASEFGVSYGVIGNIVTGRTLRGVGR